MGGGNSHQVDQDLDPSTRGADILIPDQTMDCRKVNGL